VATLCVSRLVSLYQYMYVLMQYVSVVRADRLPVSFRVWENIGLALLWVFGALNVYQFGHCSECD
jgi:hypothetical protein